MSDGRGAPQTGGATMWRRVTIHNRKGLHARAAAKFVKTAAQFDADVTVGQIVDGQAGGGKVGPRVSGRSIMGLMMLAAGPGSEIELEARGRQAAAALKALTELVGSHFDED